MIIFTIWNCTNLKDVLCHICSITFLSHYFTHFITYTFSRCYIMRLLVSIFLTDWFIVYTSACCFHLRWCAETPFSSYIAIQAILISNIVCQNVAIWLSCGCNLCSTLTRKCIVLLRSVTGIFTCFVFWTSTCSWTLRSARIAYLSSTHAIELIVLLDRTCWISRTSHTWTSFDTVWIIKIARYLSTFTYCRVSLIYWTIV